MAAGGLYERGTFVDKMDDVDSGQNEAGEQREQVSILQNGEDYLDAEEIQQFDESMINVAPKFNENKHYDVESSSQLLQKFTSQRLTLEDLGATDTATLGIQSSGHCTQSKRQLVRENRMLLSRI